MISQADFYGGAKYTTTATDVTLKAHAPRVQIFNPTAAGVDVKLPDARQLRLGGPQFYIINDHATQPFDVQDNAGGVLFTMGGLAARFFVLYANATQAGGWSVINA